MKVGFRFLLEVTISVIDKLSWEVVDVKFREWVLQVKRMQNGREIFKVDRGGELIMRVEVGRDKLLFLRYQATLDAGWGIISYKTVSAEIWLVCFPILVSRIAAQWCPWGEWTRRRVGRKLCGWSGRPWPSRWAYRWPETRSLSGAGCYRSRRWLGRAVGHRSAWQRASGPESGPAPGPGQPWSCAGSRLPCPSRTTRNVFRKGTSPGGAGRPTSLMVCRKCTWPWRRVSSIVCSISRSARPTIAWLRSIDRFDEARMTKQKRWGS